MKTKSIIWIILVIIAVTSISCDGFRNCMRGDGNYITETRVVSGDFIGIEMDGSFDVIVTKDTVTYIEIEADSNLLPFIITRVRSNRLLIDTEERCLRSKRSIKVFVSMPYIDQIMLDGSGSIEVDSINADNIQMELNGSGEIYVDVIYSGLCDVYLDGSGNIILNEVSTNLFDIHHEGSGNILVEYIDASSMDINLDGSGRIEIYDIYTHQIGALIDGSGSIELEGDADNTDFRITGSGSIIAFRLYQNECDAYISGSGTIYVFVYEYLTVDIPGSGIVYYDGNPRVYLIGDTDDDQVIRR